MPYEVTEHHTLYTLKELESVSRRSRDAALDKLFEDMEEAWYAITFPSVLAEFKARHNEPDLLPVLDLDRRQATASGFLSVPTDMAYRWSQDFDVQVESVPVGEFYGWTGFLYKVGGEMFTRIPVEDGQALASRLDDLLREFVHVADESHEAFTSTEALSVWADEAGLLFHGDGRTAGTISDLEM